jgi:hypothetical protein
VGRALVEGLKKRLPGAEVIAVGLNAWPPRRCCAPGRTPRHRQNPVRWACRDADIVMGPIGIAFAIRCWAK